MNTSVQGDAPTARELQVLALIAGGKTTKQAAQLLGITFKTAATHRMHIMTKLHAHKAADLTRAAIRLGLVQP